MLPRPTLALLGTLTLTATVGSAQTNDGLYRLRDWHEEATSSRIAGLAGAGTVIGDYAASAGNPATLGLLQKSELGGDFASRAAGDSLQSSAGLGLLGGAMRLTSKWTIGGYVSRPLTADRDIPNLALSDGTVSGPGSLDEVLTTTGAAVAWTPSPGLHVGMSISGVHLHTEGLYADYAGGTKTFEVGIAGSNLRLISALGIAYSTDRFAVGLSGRTGANWSDVERKARRETTTSELYPVRMPSRISLGARVRPVDRLLLLGQLDFVQYSQIQDTMVIGRGAYSREDYTVDAGTEGRLAAVFSQPVGSVSVQVRLGVIVRTPALISYVGSDANEAALFPAVEGETLPTLGASVVTRHGFQVDVCGRLSGERTTITAGASYRF